MFGMGTSVALSLKAPEYCIQHASGSNHTYYVWLQTKDTSIKPTMGFMIYLNMLNGRNIALTCQFADVIYKLPAN